MESQSTTPQTPPNPSSLGDLQIDFDDDVAPQAEVEQGRGWFSNFFFGRRSSNFSKSIFRQPQGGRESNFTPCCTLWGRNREGLNHLQQQNTPPATTTDMKSSTHESTKGMKAEFYNVIRLGQVDSLRDMLDRDREGSLLAAVTPQQNTMLHIVARHGLNQQVNPILNKHPGLLTQKNVNGDIPLHLAAKADHLALVKSIVEFVKDVNWVQGHLCMMQNKDGETALHTALRHKSRIVANYLIKIHPKASFCLNEERESPLFLAAKLGESDIVKEMLLCFAENVRSLVEEGKSIVHAAISGGNHEVLKEILKKDVQNNTLFKSVVVSMKKAGISPLSSAIINGNDEMVSEILNKLPDSAYLTSDNGTFPIHVAAAEGRKMVHELLQFHPDSVELLTVDEQNILHKAAFHGKNDVVGYLLSKPDFAELINAKDKQGNTPLHYAVAEKFPRVVDALTWDKRVKLDLVNNDGHTPMDVALNLKSGVPSLKEQLTWLALRFAGATRKNFNGAKRSIELEKETTEIYKDRVNTLSVVATLVTTMSFAAGFTMPGGNNGSDPDIGLATYLNKRIFQLFVISNSVALYTSVLDVLVLIFAMLGDVKMLQVSLKLAVPLLAISLAMVSIGFMSAAYLVVSKLLWLGIVIWVMGSVYLVIVLALFFMLSPPLSAKHQLTRYIAYLPFLALLYINEMNDQI